MRSAKLVIGLLLLVFCAVVGVSPALGHHSVAGQFDVDKVVSLTGTISEVEWINPHIYVHLDVKDEQGNVVTWRMETSPPAMMRKARLSKSMLRGNDGETVTITGLTARDGTKHLGFIYTITYEDGHFYQLAGGR